MQSLTLTLFLCALSGVAASGKDHPIVRVVGLIQDLKAKAISEGKDEAVSFTKFQYWCTTSIDELKDAIADEKEKIEELTDELAGLNKQKDSLEREIGNLEEQLKDLQASAAAAKDDRAAEAKLYNKANRDLASTVQAMKDCIRALSGAESKTEGLVQHHVKMVLALASLKITDTQRSALESFAARPKQAAAGDKAAHVDKYDFKSENVIELLKELQLNFEDDKLAGTKAETNALNSYNLAKRSRDNSIAAADKSKKQKTTTNGTTVADITQANKDKKMTNGELTDDSNSLDDTEKACRVKTSEWETRSATRKNEIEAMDQAVKILSKSSGVRTAAPGNPIPPASPVMFLQVQIRSTDPKMKAVALLKEAASAAHSRALERLAQEVAAHLNGPFDQVNNMIEKMIFRLMDEQKQEDEHKHWCDQEIKKTNVMKTDKDDKIEDLKAEIKVETAEVGKLTNEITDANKMISDIETFMKDATEIRNTGKKENALAIKDSEQAQTSLTNAIAVLTAFYKESGEVAKEPWEFIQGVKLPKNPATWDSEYTGVSDPDKQPGGIVSVLEGVLGDFSKMEAETKSQEAQDQAEFEESMKSNDIEKAGRTQEVTMKTAEKGRRSDKIASLSSTLKDTDGELEKTEQYLTDLKPACVNTDKGASYETRKAARAQEITALKTAQVTLQDAFKAKSANFLQIKKHSQ